MGMIIWQVCDCKPRLDVIRLWQYLIWNFDLESYKLWQELWFSRTQLENPRIYRKQDRVPTPRRRNVCLRHYRLTGHVIWPWPVTSDLVNFFSNAHNLVNICGKFHWNPSNKYHRRRQGVHCTCPPQGGWRKNGGAFIGVSYKCTPGRAKSNFCWARGR